MKTLVLISDLSAAAREAIAAAKALGAPFAVGIVGESQVPACGASRVICVCGEAFQVPRSSTDLAACAALFEAIRPEIVVAPQTSRFARFFPALAARFGGACDTHLTAFDGERARRWFYRQRMEGEFARPARPWFVLLESGVWEPVPEDHLAEAEPLDCTVPEARTSFVRFVSPETAEQTIRPDATTLFVAGAGWTKKQRDGQVHVEQAAELILGFVRNSQSSLGSSKSLVDLSGEGQAVLPFLTHLHQVGQTGSTPRHRKGLATCCHGEEPHVVGWRFINERRAINLDPNCGWGRGKADVLYVADAFEVMAKVIALL
jgi:electron transfer flavoprotein alpha subunit